MVSEYKKQKDVERAHLTIGHLLLKLGDSWTTALRPREALYCIAKMKENLGDGTLNCTFLGPVSSNDKNLQKVYTQRDPSGVLPSEVSLLASVSISPFESLLLYADFVLHAP